MTATQFRDWMAKHNYIIARLAAELEISVRQVAYYRSGEWPVPRHIELALRGLEAMAGQSER